MEKQRREESERRREEERRSKKRKSEKKEDAGARKGRKVATHCVFPMVCGSGGSQSRLAKAAGAEPSGQMRDEQLQCAKHTWIGTLLEVEMSKKCTPMWREAYFQVKKLKNATCSGHFWRFRCGFAWQRKRLCTLSKTSKNVRVL